MRKNHLIIGVFVLLFVIGTVVFFILAYVPPIEWKRHVFVYRPYNFSIEVPEANVLNIGPPEFPPKEYSYLLHLIDRSSQEDERVGVTVQIWNNDDGQFDNWVEKRKGWYILGTLDDWNLLDEKTLEVDEKRAVQYTLLKQYDEYPERLWTIVYVDGEEFVYDISINRQRSYPAERIEYIINSIDLNNPESDKTVY